MTDIEGLSLHAPTTRLMQVAVQPFDAKGVVNGLPTFNEFLVREELFWVKDSESTLSWWKSRDTWEEMFHHIEHHGIHALSAMVKLVDYYQHIRLATGQEEVYIWANHPTYDISVLQEYLTQCNIGYPWRHSEVRDYATVIGPYRNKIKWPTTSHLAHQDCIDQVNILVQCINMGARIE